MREPEAKPEIACPQGSPKGERSEANPHVRFGGRGGANQCAVPTPIGRFAP